MTALTGGRPRGQRGGKQESGTLDFQHTPGCQSDSAGYLANHPDIPILSHFLGRSGVQPQGWKIQPVGQLAIGAREFQASGSDARNQFGSDRNAFWSVVLPDGEQECSWRRKAGSCPLSGLHLWHLRGQISTGWRHEYWHYTASQLNDPL